MILLAELVEMLVWERDKIIQDGPGRDLSDLNLGSDESSSAVLNVRLHTQLYPARHLQHLVHFSQLVLVELSFAGKEESGGPEEATEKEDGADTAVRDQVPAG